MITHFNCGEMIEAPGWRATNVMLEAMTRVTVGAGTALILDIVVMYSNDDTAGRRAAGSKSGGTAAGTNIDVGVRRQQWWVSGSGRAVVATG